MSELYNDNAGATDDNETDEPEIIEEEIDTTMTAAEITGQSTLKQGSNFALNPKPRQDKTSFVGE